MSSISSEVSFDGITHDEKTIVDEQDDLLQHSMNNPMLSLLVISDHGSVEEDNSSPQREQQESIEYEKQQFRTMQRR